MDYMSKRESIDEVSLPLGKRNVFQVFKYCNAPLKLNWARPDKFVKPKGWVVIGNDETAEVVHSSDLGEPDSLPLDAIILLGRFIHSTDRFEMVNNNTERIRLSYVPLLFLYDFETKDPRNTKCWVSNGHSDDLHSAFKHRDFRQDKPYQYFNNAELVARMQRFEKHFKKAFT